jgi:hypothetical protein
VNRKTISFAGVLLLVAVTSGLAQEAAPTQPSPIPALTQGESECAGFITTNRVSEDLYVFDGADNDHAQPLRQFTMGNYVYLRSRSGANPAVGTEYRVVRPANQLFRAQWYQSQWGSIKSLGQIYEDIGKVKVLSVTPYGAVAEVTFVCGPISIRDLVIPSQARTIPEYVPTPNFERFPPPNGKLVGAITATRADEAYLANGHMAYVNLGQEDGARPGQRYRIFRIFRDQREGILARKEPPRETVGELVIISTQEKSSVAMVVNSIREITLGDGIELE